MIFKVLVSERYIGQSVNKLILKANFKILFINILKSVSILYLI